MGIREADEVLKVEPYSRAYFDLLERIPELKPYAQEFPQVEIQGRAIRISLQEGGLTTLARQDLERARARFITGNGAAR